MKAKGDHVQKKGEKEAEVRVTLYHHMSLSWFCH